MFILIILPMSSKFRNILVHTKIKKKKGLRLSNLPCTTSLLFYFYFYKFYRSWLWITFKNGWCSTRNSAIHSLRQSMNLLPTFKRGNCAFASWVDLVEFQSNTFEQSVNFVRARVNLKKVILRSWRWFGWFYF